MRERDEREGGGSRIRDDDSKHESHYLRVLAHIIPTMIENCHPFYESPNTLFDVEASSEYLHNLCFDDHLIFTVPLLLFNQNPRPAGAKRFCSRQIICRRSPHTGNRTPNISMLALAGMGNASHWWTMLATKTTDMPPDAGPPDPGGRALAGAGDARRGRGRGRDRRCWRSLSISSGHWDREVPPPGSGRSSYFGQLPLLDVEHSPSERSPSRAPDGGWIFRRTNGRPPDF